MRQQWDNKYKKLDGIFIIRKATEKLEFQEELVALT
jgi:hypothetical protein